MRLKFLWFGRGVESRRPNRVLSLKGIVSTRRSTPARQECCAAEMMARSAASYLRTYSTKARFRRSYDDYNVFSYGFEWLGEERTKLQGRAIVAVGK